MLNFLDKEEALGTSVALDSAAQTEEDTKLVNDDEEEEEMEVDKRKIILKFVNASFSWKRGNPPVLHSLDLVIPAASLTVIIGELGTRSEWNQLKISKMVR